MSAPTIVGLTPHEGEVIRAVAQLGEWKDVCGIGRETLGRELTKPEAWVAGREASALWCKETGLTRPQYALMPKRLSDRPEAPAHLKAVYPPSWVSRVEKVVRSVASRNAVENDFQEYDTNIGENPLIGTPVYELFHPSDETR